MDNRMCIKGTAKEIMQYIAYLNSIFDSEEKMDEVIATMQYLG